VVIITVTADISLLFDVCIFTCSTFTSKNDGSSVANYASYLVAATRVEQQSSVAAETY